METPCRNCSLHTLTSTRWRHCRCFVTAVGGIDRDGLVIGSLLGQPRVSASEVMQITRKNEDRNIIDFALVLREGVCYRQFMIAHWETSESIAPTLEKHFGEPAKPAPFEKLPVFSQSRL
jgi:hypothetical protein